MQVLGNPVEREITLDLEVLGIVHLNVLSFSSVLTGEHLERLIKVGLVFYFKKNFKTLVTGVLMG